MLVAILLSVSPISSNKSVNASEYKEALEDFEKAKASRWSLYRARRVKHFIAVAEDYKYELRARGTYAQLEKVTEKLAEAERVLEAIKAQNTSSWTYLRAVLYRFILSIFNVYSLQIWSSLAAATLGTALSISLLYLLISYNMRTF